MVVLICMVSIKHVQGAAEYGLQTMDYRLCITLRLWYKTWYLCPGLNAVTNFANFTIFPFSFKFNKFAI